MSAPLNSIIHGKCLEVLRQLPDNSVDSIVTDPPYGLGTKEPSLAEILAYLQEQGSLDLGEFMNRDWDLPSVTVWKECFRVLKPGGHLVAFAGTKTHDIISIAIRVAGFEKRDEIDVEFGPPSVRWIRAQGMPKSTDLEKAIDFKERKALAKHLQACRKAKKLKIEEVAAWFPEGTDVSLWEKQTSKNQVPTQEQFQVLEEKLEASRDLFMRTQVAQPEEETFEEFDGFGTALKPYWEPALLFRKPIEEATVLDQVMATGTGGLNIRASRVKHSSKEDFEKHKAGVDAIKARGGMMGKSWKNSSDLSGANEVQTEGRFPPNVLIVHAGDCKKLGTKKVPAHVINRFDDGAKPFGGAVGEEFTTIPMGDENGEEEIDVWDCAPNCPAKIMNDQSGFTVTKPDKRSGGALDTRSVGWRFQRQPSNLSDSGGASRYFPNFEPDSLLQYVPKPSRREKSEGLPDGEENEHVTVKPVSLMRYLVRLVTPKEGVVLDIYCGSGTTCVAAIEEGFKYIGIEKEEPSVRTARLRTEHAFKKYREWKSQVEAFDLAASMDDDESIIPA